MRPVDLQLAGHGMAVSKKGARGAPPRFGWYCARDDALLLVAMAEALHGEQPPAGIYRVGAVVESRLGGMPHRRRSWVLRKRHLPLANQQAKDTRKPGQNGLANCVQRCARCGCMKCGARVEHCGAPVTYCTIGRGGERQSGAVDGPSLDYRMGAKLAIPKEKTSPFS